MSQKSTRQLDFRGRAHWSYFAYYLHRVSGLLLACFLPLHFFLLSRSLKGEAELASYLKLTDFPIFKFGEWALVTLLALHLIGGARLLGLSLVFGRAYGKHGSKWQFLDRSYVAAYS